MAEVDYTDQSARETAKVSFRLAQTSGPAGTGSTLWESWKMPLERLCPSQPRLPEDLRETCERGRGCGTGKFLVKDGSPPYHLGLPPVVPQPFAGPCLPAGVGGRPKKLACKSPSLLCRESGRFTVLTSS